MARSRKTKASKRGAPAKTEETIAEIRDYLVLFIRRQTLRIGRKGDNLFTVKELAFASEALYFLDSNDHGKVLTHLIYHLEMIDVMVGAMRQLAGDRPTAEMRASIRLHEAEIRKLSSWIEQLVWKVIPARTIS